MATEDDDIRDRELWNGIARPWYSKASDKAPTASRLYHHLAILARPNLWRSLSEEIDPRDEVFAKEWEYGLHYFLDSISFRKSTGTSPNILFVASSNQAQAHQTFHIRHLPFGTY